MNARRIGALCGVCTLIATFSTARATSTEPRALPRKPTPTKLLIQTPASDMQRRKALAAGSNQCYANGPLTGAGPHSFVGVQGGQNVAGGAYTPDPTAVTEFAGVLAGADNAACASYTAVVTGVNNVAGGDGDDDNFPSFDSIIGGGAANGIVADDSFIGAGTANVISEGGFDGPKTSGAAIVSGSNNVVNGSDSVIVSGTNNTLPFALGITPNGAPGLGSNSSFIGAGDHNTVAANESVVGGGSANTINSQASSIVGGIGNTEQGKQSFIGGGYLNAITVANFSANPNGSGDAVIGGGADNLIASPTLNAGYWGVIGGGTHNTVTGAAATIAGGSTNLASGTGASIPGGSNNSAAGIDSFAAGTGSAAKHDGSFVFSDDAAGAKQLATNAGNEFLVRASGGTAIYTNAGLTAGVVLRAGSGSWASLSDRAAKTAIVALDPQAVLMKVAALPVSEWSYRSQPGAIRHIGPMAQDFYAAFGVGEDDRHITSIDEDGVALAAIKGLDAKNRALDARNVALASALARKSAEIRALERAVEQLAARDAQLESRVAAITALAK